MQAKIVYIHSLSLLIKERACLHAYKADPSPPALIFSLAKFGGSFWILCCSLFACKGLEKSLFVVKYMYDLLLYFQYLHTTT